MATDVMRVRLHLRQIRVLEVSEDTSSVLRVRVASTVSRPRCPHCGFKCHLPPRTSVPVEQPRPLFDVQIIRLRIAPTVQESKLERVIAFENLPWNSCSTETKARLSVPERPSKLFSFSTDYEICS